MPALLVGEVSTRGDHFGMAVDRFELFGESFEHDRRSVLVEHAPAPDAQSHFAQMLWVVTQARQLGARLLAQTGLRMQPN
jgi:hypothetical protein